MRHLKKIAAIATAAAMTILSVPTEPLHTGIADISLSANAESIISSGECGDNAYWELDLWGHLRIFGSGEMTLCSEYRIPYKTAIISVTIENGITDVGNFAFSDCENLEKVELPDSIRSIGYAAFDGCSKLADITLPSGVTEIDSFAFEDCKSLTKLNIPLTLERVGTLAFYRCDNLITIYYEGSEEQWDNIDFESNIDVANIAESMTVYYNCLAEPAAATTTLPTTTVTVPTTTKTTAQTTSTARSSTTLVTTTAKVTTTTADPNLPPAESGYCGNSLTWEFDSDTGEVVISGSGDMFNYDSQSSPFYFLRDKIKKVTVNYGARSIGSCAFEDCTLLSDIEFTSSIKTIGKRAFFGCIAVNDIDLPNKLEKLGADALRDTGIWNSQSWSMADRSILIYADDWVIGCDNYAAASVSVDEKEHMMADTYYIKTIKEGTRGIADRVFMNMNVNSVRLPQSLEVIGESAFEGCSSLYSITVPENVSKIDKRAFYCKSLSNITFETYSCKIYDAADTIYEKADICTINECNDIFNYYRKYNDHSSEYYELDVTDGKYFIPERDGNAFLNSTAAGAGFSEDMSLQLNGEYESHLESLGVPKSVILAAKKSMMYSQEQAMGWTHGIAATMAINFTDKTYLKKVLKSQDYFDLKRPKEDNSFLALLNYYMLSQKVIERSSYPTSYEKVLKDIVNKTQDTTKAYVLNIHIGSENHSLIANGCIGVDSYYVRIFDITTSKVSWLRIPSDYSYFIYDSKKSSWISDSIDIYDPDSYIMEMPMLGTKADISKKYGEDISIVFDAAADFSITDSDNGVLEYKNGKISGNMTHIKNGLAVCNEELSQWKLILSYSSCYTIKNNTQKLSVDIFDNDDNFMSVDGDGVQSVVFDMQNNSLTMQGTSYSFTAHVGTHSEITNFGEGMVALSGSADGEVTISSTTCQVDVAAAKPLENVSAYSYVGTEVKEYLIGGESDKISLYVSNLGELTGTPNPLPLDKRASIESYSVYGHVGEIVEFDVISKDKIQNSGAVIDITYDPELLSLETLKNGSVFNRFRLVGSDGKIQLKFMDDANKNEQLIAIIKFKILTDEIESIPLEIETRDFIVSSKTPTIELLDTIPGDANLDGSVNLKDIALIRRYYADSVISENDIIIDTNTADVNADGKINLKDVVLVRRYCAGGWDVELV